MKHDTGSLISGELVPKDPDQLLPKYVIRLLILVKGSIKPVFLILNSSRTFPVCLSSKNTMHNSGFTSLL